MTVDGQVDGLTCEVYEVPTDRPEADGTLSWSSTMMVLVRARKHRLGRAGLDLRGPRGQEGGRRDPLRCRARV